MRVVISACGLQTKLEEAIDFGDKRRNKKSWPFLRIKGISMMNISGDVQGHIDEKDLRKGSWSEEMERPDIFRIGNSVPRMKKIKIRRRLYEFYTAPVTTFWSWTLAFLIFLFFFSYVLLVKTPPDPTWIEWGLLAYVVVFGAEYIRKFFMSEMKPMKEKAKFFLYNYWNTITVLAIIIFIIGFTMRSTGMVGHGRVVLAVDSVLWTMKMLDYMSVHPRLGPYITMAGKMASFSYVVNMTYIVVMLVVSLLAFGLARQSISYPNEEFHWLLIRNIFYKPYFMLYGEVYADEIDQCGDEAWDKHSEMNISLYDDQFFEPSNSCVPGYWIPPILMTIFLLIANILLISMLIAIFNHIFDATDEISQQIWLFQRYRQVMEYEALPFMPPPFTVVCHVWLCVKYSRWLCSRKEFGGSEKSGGSKEERNMFDHSLKLFLPSDQVEKLHDFEEECMEDMAREKARAKETSNDERMKRTAEASEKIIAGMADLSSHDKMMKTTMGELDQRLQQVERVQLDTLDAIRHLTGVISSLAQQHALTTSEAQFSEMQSMQLGGGPLSTLYPQMVAPSSPLGVNVQMAEEDEVITEEEEEEDETDHEERKDKRKDSVGLAGRTPSSHLRTPFVAHPRKRTATVCGTGSISESCGATSPTGGMPLVEGHNRFFGSLAALDTTGSLLQTVAGGGVRKETVVRHQRNEEYTSITDSISFMATPIRRRRGSSDNDDEESGERMGGDGTSVGREDKDEGKERGRSRLDSMRVVKRATGTLALVVGSITSGGSRDSGGGLKRESSILSQKQRFRREAEVDNDDEEDIEEDKAMRVEGDEDEEEDDRMADCELTEVDEEEEGQGDEGEDENDEDDTNKTPDEETEDFAHEPRPSPEPESRTSRSEL
uniref:Ion channel n=1 Tax=Pristionchus pacificus TaxID=54126 RepID=A0A2A6CCH8_PRIPA|eukprot:PDM75839.1 ion channel [Pristionchus pacificus]